MAGIINAGQDTPVKDFNTGGGNSYGTALYSLITVFFFWGFVAASNGIFIPFCKEHFHLSQFESQLIDFTFYGGYFIGSLALYFISAVRKVDILNRIGYKKGIIWGLFISAVGALLMVPAVYSNSFGLILSVFFLIAIGFSLQQTAANPFAVILGPPETGAHRLNLAGGVNNLGGLMGPVIVSVVLFGTAQGADPSHVEITSVTYLYLALAALFIAVAVFYMFSKLPAGTSNDHLESSPAATKPLLVMTAGFLLILLALSFPPASMIHNIFVYGSLAIIVITLLWAYNTRKINLNAWGAMQYPQLVLGMLAIFVYVGVEVTIQSNLGALLKLDAFGRHSESDIKEYVSLYWGSMMIGRWTGAISVFNLKRQMRMVMTIVVPFIAFGVILLVNYLSGTDVQKMFVYVLPICIAIVCFFLGQEKPARVLSIFAVLGMIFMGVGLASTGELAVYAFISGGLCCSIMWPSIFSLAITGLGKYTSQGSAFLIMMILGGSIIPPVQGTFADTVDIHSSYIIPLLGFAFLTFFAVKGRAILAKQGINVDDLEAAGGH